jgi:hypothetical protein
MTGFCVITSDQPRRITPEKCPPPKMPPIVVWKFQAVTEDRLVFTLPRFAATVYVPENVEAELEPPKLTVIDPETFPAPSAGFSSLPRKS